jgi:hypothetical protein
VINLPLPAPSQSHVFAEIVPFGDDWQPVCDSLFPRAELARREAFEPDRERLSSALSEADVSELREAAPPEPDVTTVAA